MCECHPCLRHQRCDLVCHLHDRIDPVIDIVNLPSACQFPADGFAHHLFIIFHDISLDRYALHRCFFKNTHVADSDQAHVQRSWDRRGSQRQYVNIFPKLFDLFFMCHAKTLFLINDQKSEIFKLYIFRQDTVCPDQDIDQTFLEICQRFLLFCRCPETAEQIHPHRIIFHPLHKIIIMLLCQDRCRHQKYNLFALLCRFKCRTDRHLCLTISDIAADQSVHDLIAFHIFFDCFDRFQLIIRLFKWKGLFKFFLPDGILTIAEAFFPLPCRIELHQIFCNIFDRTAHPCLGASPFLCAKPVQLRTLRLRIRILLDHIKLCCRNIEIAAAGILYFHIVFCDLIDLNLLDSTVNAKSMILMYNIISWCKLRKALDRLAFIAFDLFAFFLFPAENITLRDHQKPDQRIFIPTMRIAVDQHDLSCLHNTVQIFGIKCAKFLIPQILRQTFCPCSRSAQQDHALSLFLPLPQVFYQQFKTVVVGIDAAYIHAEMPGKLPLHTCTLQHAKSHTAMLLQFFCRPLTLIEQVHLSRQYISLFQTICHALPKLTFDRLCFFPEPVWFIQDNQSILRKIFRKRYRPVIKIRNQAIQCRHLFPFLKILLCFLNNRKHAGCFFCFMLFSKFFRKLLRLFFHLF